MNKNERNARYNAYVESKVPKTHNFPSLFYAFLIGGLICILGQVIKDSLLTIFDTMTPADAGTWSSIALVFLASLLTGLGFFDDIGAVAGAGTIVPITGFSNSIASPALEFKKEGLIFGMCAKMFIVAGPVIVNGVVASIIVGLIHLIIGAF